MRRRRGFLLADTAAGLALLAILAVVLAMLAHARATAATRLGAQRAATRRAETLAATLRATPGRGTPPADDAGFKVVSTERSEAAPGWAWVRIGSADGAGPPLFTLIPVPATATAPVEMEGAAP